MNYEESKNIDKCVQYLWESDQQFAEAKANVKYLDKKLKVIKAQAFLNSKGTGEVRKAESEVSEAHQQTLEEYKDSVLEMEIMGVRRETMNIRVEVWRTKSANQRKGNI